AHSNQWPDRPHRHTALLAHATRPPALVRQATRLRELNSPDLHRSSPWRRRPRWVAGVAPDETPRQASPGYNGAATGHLRRRSGAYVLGASRGWQRWECPHQRRVTDTR